MYASASPQALTAFGLVGPHTHVKGRLACDLQRHTPALGNIPRVGGGHLQERQPSNFWTVIFLILHAHPCTIPPPPARQAPPQLTWSLVLPLLHCCQAEPACSSLLV